MIIKVITGIIGYVHCWWYNPKNELSDEEIYLNWYKYYKMK